MFEVLIPSVRQASPERLVYSLSRGTLKPDLVTIVSNETQPFETYGLHVRFLRFDSETVAYGSKDVALRCNIGIWAAKCEDVLIQSDDQIASPGMIHHARQALLWEDYFWGNHRIIDFDAYSVDEILGQEASGHVSRETPTPPARHGYYSCYSGMLGFRAEFMQGFGGIDMAFNGRHGGEDQQLGKRLMESKGESKVLIVEPPYAWLHDAVRNVPEVWRIDRTNVCDHPEYLPRVINNRLFNACQNCPELLYAGPEEGLFDNGLILPYDHTQIELVEA